MRASEVARRLARLQKVELGAAVIGLVNGLTRGLQVVLRRLALRLVLTEVGERDEGATLPMGRLIGPCVLEQKLQLLAARGQVLRGGKCSAPRT